MTLRIAITGALGRVGRRLVDQLVAADHQIIAADIRPPSSPLPEGAEFAQLDVTDDGLLDRQLENADVLVHLAAFMSWRDDDASTLYDVNVTGTFRLLNAATRAGVRRIVFASSGEVYPESRSQYEPVDEAHPTTPTSIYGVTKLLGEELVAFTGRKHGIETVVIRLPHTQEADELLDETSVFSGPRFFLRRRLEQQRALGNERAVRALEPHDDGTAKLILARGEDGTPFRMPIGDARDVAAGIVLATTVPGAAGQTIGIGPDSATSMAELIPRMAEITGLPYVDVRLPGPAVSYATSNQKARDVLGFEPRWPMPAMLEQAAAWWHEHTPGSTSTTTQATSI